MYPYDGILRLNYSVWCSRQTPLSACSCHCKTRGEPYVDEPIGRISIYHSSKNVSPRTSWPNSLPSTPTHKPFIHLEINLLLTKLPYLTLHPSFKRSTKGFSPSLYCLTGWKRDWKRPAKKNVYWDMTPSSKCKHLLFATVFFLCFFLHNFFFFVI